MMRLYGSSDNSAISMSASLTFQSAVRGLLASEKIDLVVETGTWKGLGSTRTLADGIQASGRTIPLITIECNFLYHLIARWNLIRYRNVKPLWGLTVGRVAAEHFLATDAWILNPALIPDIFVDTLGDLQHFYRKELSGELNSRGLARIVNRLAMFVFSPNDDLLKEVFDGTPFTLPLILLDSAAGIGLLEFEVVSAAMRERPFWLILDDIHHLKHFRSCERIKADPRFTIVRLNDDEGWLLASYTPAASSCGSKDKSGGVLS